MGSNIDIMVYFVQTMFTKQPTDDERITIIQSINNLLAQGFSEGEIKGIINRHRRRCGRETDIVRIFQNEKPDESNPNLLKPGWFYYHSELRLSPPPPKSKYDPKTRTIVREVEPYFLEMKASYTLEELVEYYCKTMGLEINPNRMTRYKAAFLSLLESYSLDLILFTIDAAADIRAQEGQSPLSNPFVLTDYMEVGELNLQTKVTASRQEGVDRIVYRHREKLFAS